MIRDCAQGFFLLKGEFFLAMLLVEGQAMFFFKVLRDNFVCNRRYINKDALTLIIFLFYFLDISDFCISLCRQNTVYN